MTTLGYGAVAPIADVRLIENALAAKREDLAEAALR
jgi:hypothetical protein